MIKAIVDESLKKDKVEMQAEIWKATNELRDFLFERVYKNQTFLEEELRADKMITCLYKHFTENPKSLPEFYFNEIEKYGLDTAICDYISSMSDGYAISTFKGLFIPKTWKL